MENKIRTIYGGKLQDACLLGLMYIPDDHSTLNEKFNSNASQTLPADKYPTLRYMAIGNGGHTQAVGVQNISKVVNYQHQPHHAGLFNQLPFVLREVSNDLDAGQRQRYRMRRVETHGGKQYVAYYLRLLDYTNTVIQMEYKTVVNEVTTSTTFVPSVANLNPEPSAIANSGANTTTGDYLSTMAKAGFMMDEADIVEFQNACNILYGEDGYSIISEMAAVTGMDWTVSGDFNGVSYPYTDVICAQVFSFIQCYFPLVAGNTNLNLTLNAGTVEPLLKLSQ